MKKEILIYSLIQIFFFNCFSQSTFNKVYYNGGGARANTVIQTSDSAFIIAGTINTALKMDVIKVNFIGDTLWSFVYDLGPGGGDIIYTAIETKDKNYIVGGATRDMSQSNSDAFLIKLKPNGDTVWVRKIGVTSNSERCYSIKETPDGGFIFCGIIFSTSGSDCDVYLVKTDSNGFPQWKKTFGGTSWDYGNSIELTPDGGYMVFGTTYSYGIGQYSMYLIKTDSLGNLIWQKTYGGASKNYGTSIAKTIDGKYALVGGTSISTDTIAAYVLKVDTAGTIDWEKIYKGSITQAEFNAVKTLPTGELVISGDEQGDLLNNFYYGTLKKLDTNGDLIWGKRYAHFNDTIQHYFYAMDLANDGGFVMAGMTVDWRQGANPSNQMWLVKTDCMGNDTTWDSVHCLLYTSINEITSFNKEELFAFPNPFSETTTVEYIIPDGAQNCALYLCDVFGNAIKKYPITGTSNGKLTIEGSTLTSGVYSCRLVSDKKVISFCKLVIIK